MSYQPKAKVYIDHKRRKRTTVINLADLIGHENAKQFSDDMHKTLKEMYENGDPDVTMKEIDE